MQKTSRKDDSPRIHPVVKATGFVSLFTDMSSELIYPLLPEFLTTTLGISKPMFGLIEGLAEGAPAVARYFAGTLSDWVRNRKWLILAGYTLSSATKPFIGLAKFAGLAAAPFVVLILRFLDRVGKGIRGAPRDGLVADFSENAQGRAFGFQRAMDHAGAVGGGLLAFILIGWLKFQISWAIVLSAVPGLLSILTIVFFVKDKPDRAPKAVSGSRAPGKAAAPSGALGRVFGLYVVSASLFALANSSDAFLLLRAKEMGMAVVLLPLGWVALHVSKAVTCYYGGIMSDRLGRKPLLIAGWLLYAVVYSGFAWLEGWWAPWALFIVYGVFFGATEGAAKAFVADLVPSGARGRAFGILGMAEGLLLIPTSVAVGWLWSLTGSGRVPLALEALFAVAAAVWLALAVKPARSARA